MDGADKRRVLDWLYDRNKIQRVSCESAAGKRDVIERDVSGGLAALLRHLRSGGPFVPEIMMKLAEVLDPLGASTLHVGKRLSPGSRSAREGRHRARRRPTRLRGPSPGTPRRGSRRDIEKSRLIPAAGMKQKRATKGIQEASGKPRSTYYQRQKLSKQLRTKDI
jgi:hypothetical protein